MRTLGIFCAARPALLVPHGLTLRPYLNSDDDSNSAEVLQLATEMLEKVVPLMERPPRE